MRLLFTLCLLLNTFWATAQDKYIVFFKDKANSTYTVAHPEQYLSERALQRRSRQQIAIDQYDLPITPSYLTGVRQVGATVICQSKWLNYAVIEADSLQVILIQQYNFVEKVIKVVGSGVNRPGRTDTGMRRIKTANKTNDIYGDAEKQISMINGKSLHQMGLRGEGMLIAVLDAGFLNSNTIPAFDSIRNKGQILATRNFVDPAVSVYAQGSHGTNVLSCMAANVPNTIIGTAPSAQYVLLRSEDDRSEYVIEEYNYVAAAEFADSIGADVINASLGYSEFDAQSQNHTYAEMNGTTTICTKGAELAFSRGMVIVNSAGNEGNNSWRYITAPSDGYDILCIGAVDELKQVAGFSSRGPSADQRVKPDVSAMGVSAMVAKTDGSYGHSSGTSFSSPITAGMVACLWQGLPYLTNRQIINLVRRSGDHYTNPNSDIGYGIPDFGKAYQIGTGTDKTVFNGRLAALNNPFNANSPLQLEYSSPVTGPVAIKVYNVLGHLMQEQTIWVSTTGKQTIILSEMDTAAPGMYFISVQNSSSQTSLKVIKQ